MNANPCDGCSACCKMLEVKELKKPACTWCPKVSKDKQSCTIHDTAPSSCRGFECGWLSSQHSDTPLPETMRPDRSKIVITPGKSGRMVWFHVEAAYADRVLCIPSDGRRLIEQFNKRGIVVIAIIGNEKQIFVPSVSTNIKPFEDQVPLPMHADLIDG